MNEDIIRKQQVQDFEQMLEYMRQMKDFYLVTNNKELKKVIEGRLIVLIGYKNPTNE